MTPNILSEERLLKWNELRDTKPFHYLHTASNFILASVILTTAFFWFGCIPNRWYQVLTGMGGCMHPVINTGDLIFVTSPHSTPQEGDILTLAVDGKLVTHRME